MNFLHAMTVLGYIKKIKKGSANSFWCKFSAWFFHRNVHYLILYQWTKFQCHTLIPSQDTKQNMLLSCYLDSWWRCKLKIFLGSTSKATADREKKNRRRKCQKFEYLENEKIFFSEIKNIYHSFWRAIIWWKIKTW